MEEVEPAQTQSGISMEECKNLDFDKNLKFEHMNNGQLVVRKAKHIGLVRTKMLCVIG